MNVLIILLLLFFHFYDFGLPSGFFISFFSTTSTRHERHETWGHEKEGNLEGNLWKRKSKQKNNENDKNDANINSI